METSRWPFFCSGHTVKSSFKKKWNKITAFAFSGGPDSGHPMERPHAPERLHSQRGARRGLLLGARRHRESAGDTRPPAAGALPWVQAGRLRVLPRWQGERGNMQQFFHICWMIVCVPHPTPDLTWPLIACRYWLYFQHLITTRWAATGAPT